MDLRHVQCLIFIMNLFLSSGNLAKEPGDSSHYISASATALTAIHEEVLNSTLQERMLLPRPELKLLTSMTQHDILTPIPTVPATNPSNPATSTTPTYNPIPTVSNPTTPMTTPSTMNPINPYRTPSMGIPSSSTGQSWCIAGQSASQTSLQVALDYACGYGGADCSQIQPGGSCFNPDTVRNHASYAFNNYYLKNPIPSSCDFGGTAVITNIDPSTSTCQYPSTSTSYSVLNTTNPSGSTVFGSAPPDSSGRDPMSRTLPLCLTFLSVLMSKSL
ncbi:glucan endo-1,3-beta-glucosidase 13-like [Phalaenopsis equestris]|uniref:glucan endo-1,3-beta-glucosidase 13-like n=1 Tax=Phalaenopsis equestris TaxID=78828 RepID=UPI0009E37A36|nr:glucan endo-1,3-beta-glucosidase 13-like [Phalaenopsis equestris]